MTIDVAHIREQGQDMIIVPMRPEFGMKTSAEQAAIEQSIQLAAHSAGLAGRVVTVWDGGGRRMAFRCPQPWTPFFASLTLRHIVGLVNKRITA